MPDKEVRDNRTGAPTTERILGISVWVAGPDGSKEEVAMVNISDIEPPVLLRGAYDRNRLRVTVFTDITNIDIPRVRKTPQLPR
jgi:hypothetical protein